jgi:hypothetical protein
MGGLCRIVWSVTAAIVVSGGCSHVPSGGAAGTGSPAARDKGAKAAAATIAAGTLTLREYPPLPYPPGHQEYVKLLRERCGVGSQVPRLPAGVPEAGFIEEVRGWNDVMEAEIERRYGVGIFAELRAEAARR